MSVAKIEEKVFGHKFPGFIATVTTHWSCTLLQELPNE